MSEARRILVALGSTRAPKVQALKAVLRDLAAELGPAEVRAVETPSGVRETPLSRAEIMTGARNRVEALRPQVPDASYWVGLEGGLHVANGEPDGVWLENWACVSNGQFSYFGCGGSIPLPEAIICEVVEHGRSLAEVIDEIAGKQDVRSREGTWGILTRGRLTREEVFRRALLNAFAPFYSPIRF